jgi:alkylhydroperoxidase family enzyme
VEFLRVAGGEAATSLAVLGRDDESLGPRARSLARLAATLTAKPWALTAAAVADAGRQGLDEEQVETAVGVIAMFNYFTRVADATGIEFDYATPLPAFQPDRRQAAAPRPARAARPGSPGGDEAARPRPRPGMLRAAWQSWRAYLLAADEPLSRPDRRLLASVAAEEAADWAGAEALAPPGPVTGRDAQLIAFARKLSRQPWRMEAADLDRLRASGYSEAAVLHAISVVAHQNADSRLAAGLAALNPAVVRSPGQTVHVIGPA